MMNVRFSRAIAAVLAVSLVVSAPGSQAWGQVAATVRPTSAGAGLARTSGSITPAASFALPSLSLSAPSLSLSAPSINALAVAPSAAALAVAPPALAVARVASVSPVAAVKAQASSSPASLIAGLSAASKPSTDKTSDGSLGRLTSYFDGMSARRPMVDAVDAPAGQNEANPSGLSPSQQPLVPVLVTLADPGTKQVLDAVILRMHRELGFRVDAAYGAVRSPGAVTVRGAIPVSNLKALGSAIGVVSVAVAPGGMSRFAPAAPAAPAAQPARENLLRAGLRSLMTKSPMWGVVAMLPLQFAIMVAFMGPVMGGIALSGAAEILKPWMLGTAAGMAASFSFLAPLFSWIPLKLRVAASYAAAGGLAVSFYALAPGLPALWLGANLALSLFATFGSLSTLAKADNKNPIDKAVNSTEAAAFLNILGYQATLPILILAGMMPLAYGILAVSTGLALSLLLKSGAKAAPSALTSDLSAPATPEGPDLANLRFRDAAPATRPTHTPFVPATRVVAEMEKLLKTDPAAALKLASAAIINVNERRAEVKIGAQRILDVLPLEQTLSHYLDLLKLTARQGIQTHKELNQDPWWYLQRTALKRLARDAAELKAPAEALKPLAEELLDVVKASYKDRNPSVRLATAATLTALGVDPGPEPVFEEAPPAPAPGMTPAPASAASQPPKQNKVVRWISIGLLTFMFGWMAVGAFMPRPAPPAAPTQIEQTIKAPIAAPADSTKADAVKADPKDAALEQIAKDTKRTADAAERSAKAAEEMAKPKGTNWLMMIAMAVLPIFLLVWLLRKMQGGGGQAGGINTKPKMDLEKPKARFDDVAGIDESLVEVQEIIDFLRDPARFKKLGARMPKGILMEGPPGTGKTLLARALAGETDATFISISGSDFVELYVGMGARRVRELFETARKNSPAIIFIDEIDAVGKKRGDGGPGQGSNDEREQTINQILKEMDGFDNSSGVLVVAATNRADTLDAALTRPGRFDRKIHVGLPEAMGREAILALHARKARLGPDVDMRLIARRTAGLSGAFLENVINEAALLAARRGADAINGADIDEAVDRATIGGKRSLRLSEPLKRRIAAHEAGHVLANLLNEKAEVRVPVNKVTIMPHGSGALGFAESGSEEGDKYLYTRAELEARLDTALGGLVAEKIFYGEWSTGPGSDLESATRVARAMVQQLGMSEEMGLAQTAPNQYGQSSFGSETDAKALTEINKLLKASMDRTEARLRAGADKHKAMIEALMEKETLSADEIEAIAHPKPKL